MNAPASRSRRLLAGSAIAFLVLAAVFVYQANRWFRHTRAATRGLAEASETNGGALAQRNALQTTQNVLLAAERRIAASAALGEALGWAATEVRLAGGVNEPIEARLIALSRDLDPVGAVGEDGRLGPARWSVERGNLIVGLSGLGVTNFHRYTLRGADLGGITLRDRTLDWMQVFDANLERANLHGSRFRDCVFAHAELRGVRMPGCDLARAVLAHCSLVGADLRGANVEKIIGWNESDWLCANIHGVTNPPEGFVEFVLDQGGLSLPEEYWEEALLVDGLNKSVIPELVKSSDTFAKRYRNNLQSALGIALADEQVRAALVQGIKAYQAERAAANP